MAVKLTWDEIKATYPDEWVALVDHDWPNDRPVPVAGVVFAHSADHAQLIEMQKQLTAAAIVWTGKKRGEMLRAATRVDDPVRPR
jgi:hypothetical protein